MTLTPQDRIILKALSTSATGRSYDVAERAKIHTSSRGETAARHLIKLTKLGLAKKIGTRMFPAWSITHSGLQYLKEKAND